MTISGRTLLIIGGLLLAGALAAALINRYVTVDAQDLNRAAGKPQFLEAEGTEEPRIACNAFKSPHGTIGDTVCDNAGVTTSARTQSAALAAGALLALVAGLIVSRRTAKGARAERDRQAEAPATTETEAETPGDKRESGQQER